MQKGAAVAVSTQHFFFASYWGILHRRFALISLCNMLGYTMLRFFEVSGACFVGDAVLRAGDGCFGLAIQDYCAVQAGASLPYALSA